MFWQMNAPSTFSVVSTLSSRSMSEISVRPSRPLATHRSRPHAPPASSSTTEKRFRSSK